MPGDVEELPYIRWEYSHPSRHKNGPAVVELYLVSSDGSPLEDASWFYRLLPLGSYRELLQTKDEPVRRAGTFDRGEAEGRGLNGAGIGRASIFRLGEAGGPKGAHKLVVASGTYMMVDVLGSALVRGRRCYAQAAMLLFGDSLEAASLASNTPENHWPSYGFMGSGDLYWPQTGQSYTLTPRGWVPASRPSAIRDSGPVPGQYSFTGEVTSFTPDHDPELSAQSSSATKPIFMVGRLPDGGAVTYTLYVHRSRYAGTDLGLGIGLFAAALLVTSLGMAAVYVIRRMPRHASEAV
ncbi:MAG: hypothetical protein LBW85_10095 [Deltaproteobacteria bacterium]|nr:hypothetical protein [Deltaproteobacteria bacterium]